MRLCKIARCACLEKHGVLVYRSTVRSSQGFPAGPSPAGPAGSAGSAGRAGSAGPAGLARPEHISWQFFLDHWKLFVGSQLKTAKAPRTAMVATS